MTTFSDDNGDAPAGGSVVGQEIADHEHDTQPTVITPFAQTQDVPLPGFAAPSSAPGDFHADDILPVTPPGGRRSRREALESDPDHVDGGATTAGERRTTPSPLGRLVVPIALALVSAVALFAAWTHLQDTSTSTVPVGAGGPSASSPAIPTFDASPGASTSPTSATSPSDSPSPAASSPAASSPAASSPAASSPPASSPAATPSVLTSFDRQPPVIVLNATNRPGLASKVAAKLRAQGWKVVSVGNWRRGGVTSTTSYMIGHLKAAATMQHDLPTVTLVDGLLPGMQKLHLTLVIGDDYQG
jgi:hypothetical protein